MAMMVNDAGDDENDKNDGNGHDDLDEDRDNDCPIRFDRMETREKRPRTQRASR